MRRLSLAFLASSLAVALLAGPASGQFRIGIGGHYGGHHSYGHSSYGHHGRHHLGHSGVRFGFRLGHGAHYSYSKPYRTYRYRSYSSPRYYGYSPYRSYSYSSSRYSPRYRSPAHSSRSYHHDRYVPFTYSPRHDSDADHIRQRDSSVTGVARRAWDTLGEGHDSRALDHFADLASAHPGDGLPKIGYALASAGLGDDSKAAWGMRRALRADPGALNSVYPDEALTHRLERMRDRYADRLGYGADSDAWLMLNAIRVILGEHEHVASDLAESRRSYQPDAELLAHPEVGLGRAAGSAYDQSRPGQDR